MVRWLAVLLFVALAVLRPLGGPRAHAAESTVEGRHFSLRLSERAWLSTGSSHISIGGIGGVPAVVSDLKWKDVKSNILIFGADALFKETWTFKVEAGFGYVGGGHLRDQDFTLADPPCSGRVCADTTSQVNDEGVSFINVDLGYRIAAWTWRDGKHRSFVDVLIGYQRWKEKYVATHTQDLDPLGLGSAAIDPGRALTEEFTWNNARVGARTSVGIFGDLAFHGTAYYIPWTMFDLQDVHHFRGDLKQDPSFHAVADQGFKGSGVQLEAGLSYRLWRTLTVDLGYQFWTVRSAPGMITARQFGGDTQQAFNPASTTRHGVVIGLAYTF